MEAIFINCTLKKSPEESNTEVLINKAVKEMEPLGVKCEVIRAVDYNILPGVVSDAGEGDEWPQILHKIKSANILVIGSPIWLGTKSSVAQRVLERLDALFAEADEVTGQYPLYNMAGGCIVTGNEDGAQTVSSRILYNLSQLGCTIPPNAGDAYWVGRAGAGPSYKDEGLRHLYTNKTVRWMAHNLVYFAKLLKENPIPTNLNKLSEEAKKESDT